MKKNNKKGITILGLAIILISVLYIPISLYPIPFFQEHPKIENIKAEIDALHEMLQYDPQYKGKTKGELEETLIQDLKHAWVKNLLFYFLSIVYGILIILRKNIGRLIAILASMYLIANNLFFWVKYPKYYFSFKAALKRFELSPADTLLGWSIMIICAITVMYLLVPSVRREFKCQIET